MSDEIPEGMYKDHNGYLRYENSDKLVHRHLMEKKLRRKLKAWEVVHHKDENKLNNRPENLELYTEKNAWQDHNNHHQTKWKKQKKGKLAEWERENEEYISKALKEAKKQKHITYRQPEKENPNTIKKIVKFSVLAIGILLLLVLILFIVGSVALIIFYINSLSASILQDFLTIVVAVILILVTAISFFLNLAGFKQFKFIEWLSLNKLIVLLFVGGMIILSITPNGTLVSSIGTIMAGFSIIPLIPIKIVLFLLRQ
jgi:ABC-type multidrug transport system fused ATPase/permease subunit